MGQRPSKGDELLTRLQHLVRDMPDPVVEPPVLPNRIDRVLSALDSMNFFVWEFDGEGRTVYASPNIDLLIGFTTEECLASDCIEFHPDDLPEVIAGGKKVRATGEPARNLVRIRHKRGHWIWTDSYVAGWHGAEEGDFHTIVVNRDITELKNAEAARRESEVR